MSSAEAAFERLVESRASNRVRWARFIAVLALPTLLIAGLVWVNTYQPLSVEGGLSGLSPWHLVIGSPETYGDQDTRLLAVDPGEEFIAYFTIWNEGLVGVTVEAPDFDPGEMAVFTLVGAVGPVDIEDVNPREFRPFEEFALEPGDYRVIGLRYRFEKCLRHQNGWLGRPSETFNYSTFGMSQAVTLDLPRQLVVDASKPGSCLD